MGSRPRGGPASNGGQCSQRVGRPVSRSVPKCRRCTATRARGTRGIPRRATTPRAPLRRSGARPAAAGCTGTSRSRSAAGRHSSGRAEVDRLHAVGGGTRSNIARQPLIAASGRAEVISILPREAVMTGSTFDFGPSSAELAAGEIDREAPREVLARLADDAAEAGARGDAVRQRRLRPAAARPSAAGRRTAAPRRAAAALRVPERDDVVEGLVGVGISTSCTEPAPQAPLGSTHRLGRLS